MQRGRRGGRGRNSHPARSSSRRATRGTSSASRRAASQSQTRSSSLRRSARLAQLFNGRNAALGDTNASMSSVARPRALGNGTTRTTRQPSSRNPGRSRGRQSVSPEDIHYAMDVVVQPPSTARAGAPLAGAVIVRLRTTNIEPEHVVGDSSHLYAWATLVPGPNSTVPNDPHRLNTLLRGPRLDSVRSFRDAVADGSISFMEMDDPRGVGIMIFNGLEIWQAGSYRIRITLARFVTEPDGREGYVNIQAVESNPILVQGASPPTRLVQNGVDEGEDDGGWLEVLRAIQERRRSR